MPPARVSSATTELSQLIYSLKRNNVDGASFISERELLERFDEPLLARIFRELEDEVPEGYNHDLYHAPTWKNVRLCLAILTKISRPRYIFWLCEDERISDDKLPISRETLQDAASARAQIATDVNPEEFADIFYDEQFMFKPVIFRQHSDTARLLRIIPDKKVLPIMRKENIERGGWSVVTEVEIYPDCDELEYELEEGDTPHVYALKELDEEGVNQTEKGPQEFRSEIQIQFRVQSNSQYILPLLSAFKHKGRYCLIFPRADRSLRKYLEYESSPETTEQKLKFMRRALNIASALCALHDFDEKQDSSRPGKPPDIKAKAKLVGSHRDITARNILLKGDRALLADFGHARMKRLQPGEDSGADWRFGISTYRAPECTKGISAVGRGGDIWSLACIISEMLTFALGGKEKLDQFKDERQTGTSDCFHDGNLLKEEVHLWFKKLERVADESRTVTQILKLLQRMLRPTPKERPVIREVEKILAEILDIAPEQCIFLAQNPWPELEEPVLGRTTLDETAPRTSNYRVGLMQMLTKPFSKLGLLLRSSALPDAPAESPFPQNDTVPPDRSPGILRAQSQPHTLPSQESNGVVDRAGYFQGGDHVRNETVIPKINTTVASSTRRSSMTPQTPVADPLDGALQNLRYYDTVFVFDDSNTSDSRWVTMGQALLNLASVAMKSDPDGIDVYFVESDDFNLYSIKDWEKVANTFCSVERSQRKQLLYPTIQRILHTYVKRQKEMKRANHEGPAIPRSQESKAQLNLLVLTDGTLHEDDESELEGEIKSCIRELDRIEAMPRCIGIQFILFGDPSETFRRLDDDLPKDMGTKRDMVDKTEITEDMLQDVMKFKKTLLGAIRDEFDRMDGSPEVPRSGLHLPPP